MTVRFGFILLGALLCGGCSSNGDDLQWLEAELAINELMSSNDTVIADDEGEYDDWVEIYNGSEEDVDLGGCYVSDKTDEPLRVALPSGLVVPAGGVLLLWVDNDPEQGDAHLPFKLKQAGEAFLLSSPDGDLLDSVDFGVLLTDESLARHPDGTGDFSECVNATPGELNGTSCD